MRLTEPQMEPCIEQMVTGYENRRRRKEAWALNQETCDSFRRGRRLTNDWIQPWLVRGVKDHEQCGRREKAWELIQKNLHAIFHVGQFVKLTTLP